MCNNASNKSFLSDSFKKGLVNARVTLEAFEAIVTFECSKDVLSELI